MELIVQKREKFGKAVKELRRQGLIPAELYGHGIANEHLTVSAKEFGKAFQFAGENTIINLMVDNQPRSVLIYNVQKNYLNDEFINVDFYQVKMDKEIQTEIPLIFIGEAPAVKELGGILVKAMREIEIRALPANLPRQIEVSLSGLDAFNKSVYVRDLSFIQGVKFLVDPDTVIITVKEPKVEEEKVEAVPVIAENKEKEIKAVAGTEKSAALSSETVKKETSKKETSKSR